MVSKDGVHPGSLVASVSGLVGCAQLEGPRLEGLHQIVHLCVNRIFGFGDGNFFRVLLWYQGHFLTDCLKVPHHWHLRDRNPIWD